MISKTFNAKGSSDKNLYANGKFYDFSLIARIIELRSRDSSRHAHSITLEAIKDNEKLISGISCGTVKCDIVFLQLMSETLADKKSLNSYEKAKAISEGVITSEDNKKRLVSEVLADEGSLNSYERAKAISGGFITEESDEKNEKFRLLYSEAFDVFYSIYNGCVTDFETSKTLEERAQEQDKVLNAKIPEFYKIMREIKNDSGVMKYGFLQNFIKMCDRVSREEENLAPENSLRFTTLSDEEKNKYSNKAVYLIDRFALLDSSLKSLLFSQCAELAVEVSKYAIHTGGRESFGTKVRKILNFITLNIKDNEAKLTKNYITSIFDACKEVLATEDNVEAQQKAITRFAEACKRPRV